MILKGSQRGGAQNLADHLLDQRENDHVEIIGLRGVASSSLHGAFHEIDAVSRGTRASQPFFSVSLNPPEDARMTAEDFLSAADSLDDKFALSDQPRAIVLHEKNARLHAHVIWSRIDTDSMTAIELPFFKQRLQEASRDLYQQHGLALPEGLQDRNQADAGNFSRSMWQQTQRLGEDPRDLKQMIGQAWETSDSAKAFQAQLEGMAMQLARGDRRGFVVVHHSGEALPLNRYLSLKQKDLRAKLGPVENHITIDQARSQLRGRMSAQAEQQLETLQKRQQGERRDIGKEASSLRDKHRTARHDLKTAQDGRGAREELERAKRLRKGLGGLWQRLTGEYKQIVQQNKAEKEQAHTRDGEERETLRHSQLDERGVLQRKIERMKDKHQRETNQQRAVLGQWLSLEGDAQRDAIEAHIREQDNKENRPERARRIPSKRGKGRQRTITGP